MKIPGAGVAVSGKMSASCVQGDQFGSEPWNKNNRNSVLKIENKEFPKMRMAASCFCSVFNAEDSLMQRQLSDSFPYVPT